MALLALSFFRMAGADSVEIVSMGGLGEEEWDEDWSWDTLCTYGGKTFRLVRSVDPDEARAGKAVKIFTYAGRTPVDTCIVKGAWGYAFAEGGLLKFTEGVDTASYSLASLPKSIHPIREILPDSIHEHSYHQAILLKDTDVLSRFDFEAYLADDYPGWLNQLLAVIIKSDLDQLFEVDPPDVEYLKEYDGLRLNPRKYAGFDPLTAMPEEIGRYFGNNFEISYRGMFDDTDSIYWALPFEYSIQVAPAWTGGDGNKATYRFYFYTYGGGAHGMENEFFLTFDNATGRILGYEDLLDESSFGNVKEELGKALGLRRFGEVSYNNTIDIGEEGAFQYSLMSMLYEAKDGYLYPRPALIEDRVIFSYQPYDKGSFAEGVLHFVIPLKKLTQAQP